MTNLFEPQLGWISYEHMTYLQQELHDKIVSSMVAFSLAPQSKPGVGTKVMLTDLWRHQDTVKALGQPFLGWYQYSGSCVGVGGGNACQTTICSNAILGDDEDEIRLAAWYYNYGKSRLRAGMRGRGEGSLGSTFFASIAEDGVLDVRDQDLDNELPDGVVRSGQFEIGKSLELQWSDGNYASAAVQSKAKKHLMQGSQCKSAADVRTAILNGYAVTRASQKFVRWGNARVRDGVLIGRHENLGGHQESWLNYWNHPTLGELFWEQNQHGADAYGVDPAGGPAGGCWVTIDDVEALCQERYGEAFAVAGWNGYKDRAEKVLDWSKGNPFLSLS